MRQPRHSPDTSAGGANPQGLDSDTNKFLLLLCGGFFAWILFVMLAKYAAIVAPYFFYPFTMPVYAFADSGFGAGMIVIMYSVMAFALAFLKSKKGKIAWGAISYGVFFILVALGEFLFFRKSPSGIASPLTFHVGAFCNPSSDGLLYILKCRASVKDMDAIGVFGIIMISLVPNLFYGLNGINNSFKNFRSGLNHPRSKAKKMIPNVNALIEEVAPFQPHLQLYKIIDLNQHDPFSGQLRLMDSPRRFCFENDMIAGFSARPKKSDPSTYKKDVDVAGREESRAVFTKAAADDYVPILNIEKFEQTMLQSLGDVFTTVEALNNAQAVVLGLALPLACRADVNMDKNEAKSILKEVEERCGELFIWTAKDCAIEHDDNLGFGRFDDDEKYREAIREWMQHPIGIEIFNNHAYISTIILRCLTDAKKMGVFQPSNFTWLRCYDRPLFTIIQNESRPSAFAENCAASSHFHVELKAKRMIYSPQLQIAFDGLMSNLHYYKYPQKNIEAWQTYKATGDAEAMKTLNLVSKEFT